MALSKKAIDPEELTTKVRAFLTYLETLMLKEGLPVEGTVNNGFQVRGHDVSQMFCTAITGRFYSRLIDNDYTLVGDFLDDNWTLLQSCPEPKKKISFSDLYSDAQVKQAKTAQNFQVEYQWINIPD